MDLRQLRFFMRTAELGSISRTALEVRIAQPALSRQIRSLEEFLGVQLFARDGRGVALTKAGKEFYDAVADTLQRLDNACVAAREHQNVPSGELRLGVLPNFGAAFDADIILQCEELYPKIKLILFEGFSYEIAGWIQSRQVDLGFVYNTEVYPHLSSEFVFREEAYLVGPPGGALRASNVSFSDLQNLPLITPAPPSNTRRRLDAAAAVKGIELTYSYELDSLAGIKRLVMLGKGYAVFTRAAVWEDVEAGRVVVAKIVDPEITFDLALVSLYGAMLPVPARCIMEFLKDVVTRNATMRRWSGQFVSKASQPVAGG
jgi:LysR family nitrogen assimilation transcriptional regulator